MYLCVRGIVTSEQSCVCVRGIVTKPAVSSHVYVLGVSLPSQESE